MNTRILKKINTGFTVDLHSPLVVVFVLIFYVWIRSILYYIVVGGCAPTAAAGGTLEHVCLKIRSQTALNDMEMLLCLYPEVRNGCLGKLIFERIQNVFEEGVGEDVGNGARRVVRWRSGHV